VKDRWIWILIPLIALWANLHGGFIIGLMLIGITAVGMVLDYWAGILEQPETVRSRLRVLAIVFVGCVLAGLLNPFGIKLYTGPVTVLRSSIWQNAVVDWLSPKRPKPSELLLFLVVLYSTLKTQRNAVILVLIAAPLFSNYFQIWLDTTRFGKHLPVVREGAAKKRIPAVLYLVLLLPLVPFTLKLKSTVYSNPTQQSLRVPVNAVEFLKQNGITGNTFTEPNIWGGYVLWAAPKNPVYIDGRDVYPDTFVKEFVEITQGRADWRGPFNQRGVEIALIQPNTQMSQQLATAPDWQKIYEDDMSILYKRR
jgi:hypothetical protein